MKQYAIVAMVMTAGLITGCNQPQDQLTPTNAAADSAAPALSAAQDAGAQQAEIERLAAAVEMNRQQTVLLQKQMTAARQEISRMSKRLSAVEKKGQDKRIPDTTVHDIEIGASPVLGPADAPVTIVEFVDFQCPYCSREWPKIQQVMAKYPNDVKVVFKHYPLSFHKQAPRAHAAAELAKRQKGPEGFWKMHDLILAAPKNLKVADLRGYAEYLEMDLAEFDEVLADQKRILALLGPDREAAKKCNVRGTPGVYVNGLAMPRRKVADYEKRIEQILAKKKAGKK